MPKYYRCDQGVTLKSLYIVIKGIPVVGCKTKNESLHTYITHASIDIHKLDNSL